MSARDSLAVEYLRRYPRAAARSLESFASAEVAEALSACQPADVAGALRAMVPVLASQVVAAMTDEAAAALLAELAAPDTAALLRPLDPDRRRSMLDELPAQQRQQVTRLLAHPADSAGALMDPGVLVLPDQLSVREAIARVRADSARVPPYLYLIDSEGTLEGVVDLLDLLTSDPEAPLRATMHGAVQSLRVDDPREAVLAHAGWREYRAMPVVDADGQLLGVIHRDRVRQLQPDGGRSARSISVALSLAELFWIGLAGMTEGFARASGALRDEQGGNVA